MTSHSFPEECWGRRVFAALLWGIWGHRRARSGAERSTSLFLPLSSITDIHSPRPPTPLHHPYALLISGFFFFFWGWGLEHFFSRARDTLKKKADSYPLPPPPTERSHCAMHCTHRPPLSSDQLLEVSKEDFKHFKELVLRLHFFYCSVFIWVITNLQTTMTSLCTSTNTQE